MLYPGLKRTCAAAARRTAALGFAAIFALASAGSGGASVYTIQQGDTIEIAVAGLPELRSRSNVQPDGAISFPLLSALKVEGMTPAELRLEVQKQLAGKIYRIHNNSGREILTVIEAEEVSAEIVGYRPIYVTGDVVHSGEQAYRPQMTVRQAVALAGGPGRSQARASGYFREYPAVRGEYDTVRLEAARAVVRVARVDALLRSESGLPAVDVSAYGLSKEQADRLLAGETAIFTTTLLDYRREAAFLKAVVTQTDERIAVVEAQRVQEEEGSRADATELQRMIELLNRGQLTNPRVTDARRALLLSSTRALQVNVELLELKRRKAEGERNLQRLEDQRRVTLLKELQEEISAREATAIKVQALGVELFLSGKARPLDAPDEPVKMRIEVVRQDGNRASKLAGGDGFELMPGDTIEVSVIVPTQTAERTLPP